MAAIKNRTGTLTSILKDEDELDLTPRPLSSAAQTTTMTSDLNAMLPGHDSSRIGTPLAGVNTSINTRQDPMSMIDQLGGTGGSNNTPNVDGTWNAPISTTNPVVISPVVMSDELKDEINNTTGGGQSTEWISTDGVVTTPSVPNAPVPDPDPAPVYPNNNFDPQFEEWLRTQFAGPRDLTAEKDYMDQLFANQLGSGLANMNAQASMGGLGLAGGQIAMEGDLRRQSALDQSGQMFALEQGARDEAFAHGSEAAKFFGEEAGRTFEGDQNSLDRAREDELLDMLKKYLGLDGDNNNNNNGDGGGGGNDNTFSVPPPIQAAVGSVFDNFNLNMPGNGGEDSFQVTDRTTAVNQGDPYFWGSDRLETVTQVDGNSSNNNSGMPNDMYSTLTQANGGAPVKGFAPITPGGTVTGTVEWGGETWTLWVDEAGNTYATKN